MSLSTLYNIILLDYDAKNGSLNSTVALNPDHPVFKGHFPGNPILPGVCTLEIAKDLLSKSLERDCRLSKASSVKYLGFVNPLVTPEINFQFTIKPGDSGIINCTVTVTAAATITCTFKAEYQLGSDPANI